MKKLILITGMLVIAVIANGCCSYAVMNGSKNKAAQRKALIMGDEPAIRATRLGSNGVGVGIDVTNWEALSERPFLQLGAALLDAAIIYGGYEGIKSLDDGSDSNPGNGTSVTLTDSDNNTVNVVNGDNNSSNNDENSASHGGESNLDSNE